jgi:hypothetical protein
MYTRDPFNLRKAPPTAFALLQNAATRTIETGSAAVESTKQALQDADMSFAVPRNIPQFENVQRSFEDNVWNKFSGNEKGLPMYKDKPSKYGASKKGPGAWLRRRWMVVLVVVCFAGLYFFGWSNRGQVVPDGSGTGTGDAKKSSGWGAAIGGSKKGNKVDWEKRRQDVKDAFLLSWKSYETHGWGWLIR